MPPMRVEKKPRPISLVDLKQTARRLLPRGHPLNLILDRAPDECSPAELLVRLDSIVPLIEAL